MEPEVTKRGVLDMQVCVPSEWDDGQIVAFAERENQCGTTVGWTIRKQGDELLAGMPVRNPCANRAGFVHVMLGA